MSVPVRLLIGESRLRGWALLDVYYQEKDEVRLAFSRSSVPETWGA